MIEVHPGANSPNFRKNDNIAYTNIQKDITIEIMPSVPINFNGLELKLIIPSEASFNIFLSGYFVSPAKRSLRSYSYAYCSNPTQLNSPLKNLLCSGKLFTTSTTFLSTNLKSPVSLGISTSERPFKTE